MKKIKFAITSTFIIIYITASFAFTAEVKNTLPSPPQTPVNIAPAVTTTQIKQPPLTSSAANVTPAATLTQIQPPPLAPAPTDNYSYNPLGKPDPFRPFVTVDVAVAKQQIAKKAEVSMFPLQRSEAEKYRVVGIAGDKDHRVAICEDAAKKFYPLYKGTHIGLYDGKVIEIMADRVIVEEYETKKPRRVILKLHKN
jgi:type IV pilus assembly protein PilP